MNKAEDWFFNILGIILTLIPVALSCWFAFVALGVLSAGCVLLTTMLMSLF